MSESDPAALYRTVSAFVEHRCSSRHGAVNLLLWTVLFTLVSMSAVLALFLLRRPGALQSRMWGQFLLHGFPVTLLVNLTAAWFYSGALSRLTSGSARHNALVLIADLAARMLLFGTLVAVSFVLWSVLVGSFAGSPAIALQAVVPSLRYAIVFQSLTGVYLYAMLLNAFPFFALFFIPLFAVSTRLRALVPAPLLRLRPIGTVVVCYVIWIGIVMTASYLLLGIVDGQSGSG